MGTKPHFPFRSARAKERYLARYDAQAKAWPVPSEERRVQTSFGETFVRVSGPEAAPPMVLLSGIGSPGLMWRYNVAALSGRYRTFAVDNIHDHGRSVESRPVTSADDFAAWLDSLLDGLALASVSLVGLSYGGWIGAHFALRHRERVRALVLIAPAGTVLPIASGFIWRGILCALPLRRPVRSLVEFMTPDVLRLPGGRALVDGWVEDSWVALRSFAPRRMVAPIPLSDDQLRSLKMPTLFVVGEHETIFPPAEALARLRAVAPQIETVLLPGCGHDLFAAQAEAMSRHVLEFLDRRRAAA